MIHLICRHNNNQQISLSMQDIPSTCLATLRNKKMLVLGYESLPCKALLRQLLPITDTKILLPYLNKKEQSRCQKYCKDTFFNQQEKMLLKEKVVFLQIEKVEEYLTQQPGEQGRKKIGIDVMFVGLGLVDFADAEKVVERHLLRISQARQALTKVTIQKCVMLSSIYSKDPGYLAQDQDLQDSTASIQPYFSTKEQGLSYLKDNFGSQIQAWKWSITYIQKCCITMSSSTFLIRTPSIGPTLRNYQGYFNGHALNNFTYLLCQVGLGNITSLDAVKSIKIDVVPADYAANLMIVLATRNSTSAVENIHLSTSTRNFITLAQFVELSREAWLQYGHKPSKIRIVETTLGRKLQHKSQQLPSQLKKRLGSLLGMVSWKIDGQRQSLQLQQKTTLLSKYKYFLCNQWLCESIKPIDLSNSLELTDQLHLDFNVNNINWKIYIRLCVYSMKKYVLNHKVEQFKPQVMDMLGLRPDSYFSDIMWALKMGKEGVGSKRMDAVQFVLNSKSVKDAIRGIVQDNMMKLQNPPTSYDKAEEELTKIAEQICVTMFSDYSMGSIRLFAWFLHKIFTTIYQKVVVDKSAIQKIQAHAQSKGPLIIIPTHRSYVDFLIVSYVFFGYNIKVPHIAAAEDFLGMAIVHILLRRSGAFFIKRNQKKHKQLYKAILNEYLSKLMVGSNFLQFFIEGTRSRTGKMLAPKYGMLTTVCQNVQQRKVNDAFILPVTINYERVLEGNSFTYEMMGQAKVKESLGRVLKSVDVLRENYGRITLQFCDMISVKDYLQREGSLEMPAKMAKLGAQIVHTLTDNLVISGSAIISSIILMNRKGISDDSLQEQTSWLSKELASRGIPITRSQPDSSLSVASSLSLLQGVVEKSKKDMFEVQINFEQNSFVKLFTLTYHRNTLTHIFYQEAVIATVLASFGHDILSKRGVELNVVWQRVQWLWKLLSSEFYLKQGLERKERFDELINFMMQRQLLESTTINGLQAIKGINLQGHCYAFYWSLIWPLVQSYWLTCLYLFKIKKDSALISLPKLYTQIQWFGQSLVNDRVGNYLEAISADTVKNAVAVYTKIGVLKGVKEERDGEVISAVKVAANESQLKVLLEKLELYLKNTYGRSLTGILGSRHGSVGLDFPFLSRL